MFSKKFYQLKDGASMGSPLESVFVNITMAELEKNQLKYFMGVFLMTLSCYQTKRYCTCTSSFKQLW